MAIAPVLPTARQKVTAIFRGIFGISRGILGLSLSLHPSQISLRNRYNVLRIPGWETFVLKAEALI
jgi:hypothetical protein